jgi:CheY-like chemotaxis protein
VSNVSLRILFADDSVTAQNMGRKILTEAGYEVVAVSNGAAAVKKIAEQKPDIIILDVYMPGYTGLEVCEKVRASMETMRTPVLLTVGKLEPYKPEDANRVKADGVIVKPFEASDLLAIIKKFEERLSQVPVLVQQPVLAERFDEDEMDVTAEPVVEHPTPSAPIQPTVEVPDHMATTAAFSDLLGAEPAGSANHFEQAAQAPVVLETPIEPPASGHATIPDYELPASWREPQRLEVELPPPAAAELEPPVPATVDFEPEPAPSPIVARPLQIPVYQDRETAENAYELMPTSAPPIGEIEIPREPHLQETAAEATRNTVADATDPSLLSTGQQFDRTLASPDEIAAAELAPMEEQFEPAGFQDIPAEITSHLPTAATEPMPAEEPAAPPVSDTDFEARVAAALSSYGQNQVSPAAVSPPPATDFDATPSEEHGLPAGFSRFEEPPAPGVEEVPTRLEPPAPINGASPSVMAAPEIHTPDVSGRAVPAPVAAPREPEIVRAPRPVPVFEYRPPVGAPSEEIPPPPRREAVQVTPTYSPGVEEASLTPEPHASEPARVETLPADTRTGLMAGIEEALPSAAAEAAASAGSTDTQAIAQAVHRVMERLKPELVEEILRELKPKKE